MAGLTQLRRVTEWWCKVTHKGGHDLYMPMLRDGCWYWHCRHCTYRGVLDLSATRGVPLRRRLS